MTSLSETWYIHYRYIKLNLVLRIVTDDLVCSALSKRGRNKIVVVEVDEIRCDIISTVTMHLGSNVFFKTYHSNTIEYCKTIRMMVYEYENRLLQEYTFQNHLSWPNSLFLISKYRYAFLMIYQTCQLYLNVYLVWNWSIFYLM